MNMNIASLTRTMAIGACLSAAAFAAAENYPAIPEEYPGVPADSTTSTGTAVGREPRRTPAAAPYEPPTLSTAALDEQPAPSGWQPLKGDELLERDAVNEPRPQGRVTMEQAASQDVSDRELTRRVRRALVTDKSLSTSAHNVKVTAKGGKVTLKGRVVSEDEKAVVEARAAEIAGAEWVENGLTVKDAR